MKNKKTSKKINLFNAISETSKGVKFTVDSSALRTFVTLSTKNWPVQTNVTIGRGRIAVRVCTESNHRCYSVRFRCDLAKTRQSAGCWPRSGSHAANLSVSVRRVADGRRESADIFGRRRWVLVVSSSANSRVLQQQRCWRVCVCVCVCKGGSRNGKCVGIVTRSPRDGSHTHCSPGALCC